METLKLEANEYVINDEVDISANKALCISEMKKIDSECIRKVNRYLLRIHSKLRVIVGCIVGCIVFSLSAVLFIIFGLCNSEVFPLLIVGIFFVPCIPLTILCGMQAEKKNKGKKEFFQTAEIFPAEILNIRQWITHGDNDTIYCEINCHRFTNYGYKEIKLHFHYLPEELFFSKDKVGLHEHYKSKKYMFLLLYPYNKKVYPVRLFRKDDTEQ